MPMQRTATAVVSRYLRFLGLALVLAASGAWAQVSVKDAWVRATVPQQRGTGAFMQITSTRDARLVEVRTPIAKVAEVHEMAMVDNVMRMRAVNGLDLPAGKTVELKPNGYHLMLMELTGQVKEGDTVPITLIVEDKVKKRETIEIKAPVRPLNYAPGGGHGKHH